MPLAPPPKTALAPMQLASMHVELIVTKLPELQCAGLQPVNKAKYDRTGKKGTKQSTVTLKTTQALEHMLIQNLAQN